MRVLVLGHNGMLGSEVLRYVGTRGVAAHTLSSRCDARDPGPFMAELQEVIDGWTASDAIFNCIGAIPQKHVADPRSMYFTNGVLPNLLAMAVRGVSDATLIHPSTDCVFAGEVRGDVATTYRGMYEANSAPDATDTYGRSKAIGDLISTQPNVLVLRTSIVGIGGAGLLTWALEQPRGATINGWSTCRWNGITTLEWAKVALEALARGDRGLHHVSCLAPLSKYELLRVALRTWGREDVEVVPTDKPRGDRTLLANGAYRRASIETLLAELREGHDSVATSTSSAEAAT